MRNFVGFFRYILEKNNLEEVIMKKFNFKRCANVLASVAMMFSILAVNTRCVFIFHQPKMPEAMKKLKKN